MVPLLILIVPLLNINQQDSGQFLPALAGSSGLVLGTLLISVPSALLLAASLNSLQNTPLRNLLRYVFQTISGMPPAIFGLGLWLLLFFYNGEPPVRRLILGVLALSLMIIPRLAIDIYESLQQSSSLWKMSAIALGIPAWKADWTIGFRVIFNDILSHILSVSARIAGETAPVFFIAAYFFSPDGIFPDMTLTMNVLDQALQNLDLPGTKAGLSGVMLFSIVVMLNLASYLLFHRAKSKNEIDEFNTNNLRTASGNAHDAEGN